MHFINKLFSTNPSSIWDAFTAAKAAVALQAMPGENGYGVGEDSKFIMFPSTQCKNWEILNTNLKPGKPVDMTIKPKILILPKKLDWFIGREIESKVIIEKLMTKRLICIEGASGIGKSALLKNLVYIFHPRCTFEDGILYLSIKDWQTFESLLQKFWKIIKEWFHEDKYENKSNSYYELYEYYINLLLKIKRFKILIWFDNWDKIIELEYQPFKEFIKDLLEKLTYCKMIITSQSFGTGFTDISQEVVILEGLNNLETMELIKAKWPSMKVNNNDLNELQLELIKSNPKLQENKNYLFEHQFFKILNGHPLSIILLSSLRISKYCILTIFLDMSLKEIWDILNMIKNGIDRDVDNSPNLAVYLSIEASLMFIKKANLTAYNAWLWFSLWPSGLSKNDLISIFGNKWSEWEQLLLSRELIKIKNMVENNFVSKSTTLSFGIPILSKKRGSIKKNTMFSMDLSLIKIIEARMSNQEIEKSDKLIVSLLIKILERLHRESNNEEDIADEIEEWENNTRSKIIGWISIPKFRNYSTFVVKELENKLMLYEGNVWSALSRIWSERVIYGINSKIKRAYFRGNTSNTAINEIMQK